MNKNMIIAIAVIAIIIIAGVAYFSFNSEDSVEQEQAGESPVLETDENVFDEFDSAIEGIS